MATPVKTPRPSGSKWKPVIKPEAKGKQKVELEIPQDQYDALTAYGAQILGGSSVGHICFAAIQLFIQTEVEPALVAAAKTVSQHLPVAASVNGKVEASKQ